MNVAVIVLSCVVVTLAKPPSLIFSSENRELALYRERVNILHDLIKAECPTDVAIRAKRDTAELTDLRVEKLLYARLRAVLLSCKQSSTTGPKATKSTVKPTTTGPTTTTEVPLPAECLNAVNLTEAWRLDHQGSNIKPVNGQWNCDTRDMVSSGRPWFRFSSTAGTRMLNVCPKSLSCGSAGGVWSNHDNPQVIGQIMSAKAYTRYAGNCKHVEWPVSVMRCSFDGPNDIVYRFDGTNQCYNSFCGMN